MIRQGLLWATLLGLCAWLSAQQTAQLDYFADGGTFEIDYDKDGREDFVANYVEGGVEWAHITRGLDLQTKYAGVASQRVQLHRASGGSGICVIYRGLDFRRPLKPEVGEPLLVRVAIRAQGFQNATYRVYVVTGGRSVNLLPPTSQSCEWQLVSGIVPVEQNSSGQPVFGLGIEIRSGEGAARGTLWIDEAQALSARTVMRNNALPNGLKIALVNPQHDALSNLSDLPVGIVIGSVRPAQVIGRHYPNTMFAPYVLFSGTIVAANARHNRDLYNYDDLDLNHPDWFLPDANGQRILRDDAYYYVDVGMPAVRERAWQSLRDFMDRCGRPRYVFFDDVHTRLGGASPRYPNNAVWLPAVVGCLEYVGSRLRNEFGATIIPNVAWSPGLWLRGMNGGADAPGVSLLPLMGGFLIEHVFTHARVATGQTTISPYGSTRDLNNWESWALRDRIRLAAEYPDKLVILLSTYVPNLPDSQQKLRFAIAGSLIVQHEKTYLKLEPRSSSGVQYPNGFYPPELFVPLGRWTENYRILNGDIVTGGLFVRNYENGIVVWNPMHDRDFTFTMPRDLYDWDRNPIRAGTVVQIPRQTGLVFYSAPEITLELSPQNAQVLPGQTVQFTVTYRNRGTAPGTNVRIAVPLPQGMTLTGSNPQARLESGQVVWTVPNVPVGGSGTLQFTVRVE